jgi:hypothetical protein
MLSLELVGRIAQATGKIQAVIDNAGSWPGTRKCGLYVHCSP